MRVGWVAIADGVAVPTEAVTDGPSVNWDHIDGPLMTWAGNLHWLTLTERLGLHLKRTTIEAIASRRWPHLVVLRAKLASAQQAERGG